MTEEKIICHECGTESESRYRYCKNCGAILNFGNKNEGTTENQSYNANGNYGNESFGGPQFNSASIDGIPIEEVQMFVGAKAGEIVPKFVNMEVTNSKTSWLWPPAILAFFFGPIGAALWFFYRKMYKPAFILAGISAVLSLITSILTFNALNNYFDSLFNIASSGNINEALEFIEDFTTDRNSLLVTYTSYIENIINILTTIIVGLYGCYWYKNHCIRKIQGFRMMNPNNNYYRLGLMSLGGTSGGMVALGILLHIGIGFLVGFITVMLAVLI